jgi:hypothetical protein
LEILAEILLQIAGWALQLLGELLIQVLFEAIAELIGHGVKSLASRSTTVRKPVSPLLAAAGYAVFGAIAGAISIWLLPHLFIERDWLRWLNLLAVPLAAGGIMSAIGAWRRHRDMRVIRLDSFAYGYCFALSMAVVRFAWGQ